MENTQVQTTGGSKYGKYFTYAGLIILGAIIGGFIVKRYNIVKKDKAVASVPAVTTNDKPIENTESKGEAEMQEQSEVNNGSNLFNANV